MQRFIAVGLITILTLITLSGCQANILTEEPADSSKTNDTVIHNQYVNNINEILEFAEITIDNYQKANRKFPNPGQLETDLNNLASQVRSSELELLPLQASPTLSYQSQFKSSYLEEIKTYIGEYRTWLESVKTTSNSGPFSLESLQLETSYSSFISIHNDFVQQINEQI